MHEQKYTKKSLVKDYVNKYRSGTQMRLIDEKCHNED